MEAHALHLTRTADKAQRKLDKPLRVMIRDALLRIAKTPQALGEALSQPLTGLYTHHITYKGKEFRIAYQIDGDCSAVMVLMIGPHENFYKKLKNLVYAA